jgi:hypothetical protein
MEQVHSIKKTHYSVSGHFFLLSLLCIALTIYLGYFVNRNDFSHFIFSFTAFFTLYIWACFFQKTIPAKHLIALGIALRVLLLFSIPNLSDDYVRFIWDGRLTLAGYHPFLHPPSYFIENQILPPGITHDLYQQLNSPRYFTVYPPVCQAVFALAAWISAGNNWLAVLVIKLFLLTCEIGTIKFLIHAHSPSRQQSTVNSQRSIVNSQRSIVNSQQSIVNSQQSTVNRQWSIVNGQPSAIYALNPLLLFEIVGNCHFEGAMIFFLVAGIAALRQGKIAQPAVYWALATASKMLPLMFLPIVWRWLGWRKGLIFNVVFGVVTLVLFAPLIAVLPNIAESLDLYFREFQFNASIYYLVREVGYAKIGWDIGDTSGPRLALVAATGILLLALTTKKGKDIRESRLETAMLFAVFLYMSLAAVVQPWYVCVPLAISLFTRWRFVVLWSGLAALSYSHYDGGLRQEHWGLILLEYTLLWGYLLWECMLPQPHTKGTTEVV